MIYGSQILDRNHCDSHNSRGGNRDYYTSDSAGDGSGDKIDPVFLSSPRIHFPICLWVWAGFRTKRPPPSPRRNYLLCSVRIEQRKRQIEKHATIKSSPLPGYNWLGSLVRRALFYGQAIGTRESGADGQRRRPPPPSQAITGASASLFSQYRDKDTAPKFLVVRCYRLIWLALS